MTAKEIEDVISVVCIEYGVEKNDVIQVARKTRIPEIVRARTIIIKALIKNLTLNRIGSILNLHHSSIIYLMRQDERFSKDDFEYRRVSSIINKKDKHKLINIQIEFHQNKIDKLKKLIK